MSGWKQKLQNPFALVGQGFVVGVVLFWTFHPGESAARDGADRASTPAAEQTTSRA